MKKYFFALSLLATLATVACDTSSKASTTQTSAVAQSQTVATTPTLATTDSMSVDKAAMKKAFSKKGAAMKTMEMAPPQLLDKNGKTTVPVKQQ